MKTIRGVYYNLEETEYKTEKGDLTLFFSSKFYKDKFDEEVESYVNQETLKQKIKYDQRINIDPILYIAFYKKVEKRGFKVLYRNNRIDPNQLIHSSMIVRG